ncbi:hypothetical protein ACOMHN_030100 [Nucella lapillus]
MANYWRSTRFVTNRGNPGLIMNGYKFRYERSDKDGKGVWQCIQKRCSARCKSFDKDPEAGIAWARLEHTHDQDSQASIERQQIRTVCKRKAVDDISERPSKIILTELTNRPDGELVPKDVKAVRQSIYRERRKLQPKLPTCRVEVHEALRDRNITSNDGEEMLQFNNERTGIILFTTLKNLQFLCQDDVEVFDGPGFESFADYVCQTYIYGPFPPAMWASRDLTRKKTTNACERFHREFGDMFYSPHPSIFAFMDKLKLQQSKTYMKIRAANSGVLALTHRDVEKQNTLLEIQAAYQHDAIAKSDYVWRLALRYQPFQM